MTDFLLSAHDLSVRFGGLLAVNQVSFDVKKGEVFTLIGPNGAGKTTVFNLISRIYTPTTGHIDYLGPQGMVKLTAQAPQDVAERLVILMDPMLATGNSAVAAVNLLKDKGVKEIRFVCLLAAPEGVEKLRVAHPDIRIWTAAIDSHLNDHGYIVPGLGDAGDRMYGTK
jgi:uracil phosphoribosyltransferase